MGTVSYGKKGQVSAKQHASKASGREVYLDKYSPVPAMGECCAADHMTRRMLNTYGKSPKSAMGDGEMGMESGENEMMDMD